MFGLKFRDVLPASVADEFDNVLPAIRKFLDREHKQDGTHSAITADSVSLQGAAIGEVVDIAHDAERYKVSGGTSWTVAAEDQVYLRYIRIGQKVDLQFYLQTTVVAGTPGFLVINIPELHAIPTRHSLGNPTSQVNGMAEWVDVTNGRSGIAEVAAIAENFSGAIPQTSIYLQRYATNAAAATFANWSATSELWVYGSLTFFVERDNSPHTFFGS